MPNWIPIVSDTDKRKVQGWVSKAPPGTMIAFKKHDARSIEQNALLWSRLSAISEQLPWHGEMLSPDEWKTVFTAALRKYRVVTGVDGGHVVIGLKTSSMTKSEMNNLLDLIDAFAAENAVALPDHTGDYNENN